MNITKRDKETIRFLLADMLTNFEGGGYQELRKERTAIYELSIKVLGSEDNITLRLKDQVFE